MKIRYNLRKQRKIEIRKMEFINGNTVFKPPKLMAYLLEVLINLIIQTSVVTIIWII